MGNSFIDIMKHEKFDDQNFKKWFVKEKWEYDL
jgi:hypothetical protein